VCALTAFTLLILFSAAVRGRGRIGHVDERWPAYWRSMFDQRGFTMLDVIRPMIRKERRVKWRYRQKYCDVCQRRDNLSPMLLREPSTTAEVSNGYISTGSPLCMPVCAISSSIWGRF